jgi:hypothetical protein
MYIQIVVLLRIYTVLPEQKKKRCVLFLPLVTVFFYIKVDTSWKSACSYAPFYKSLHLLQEFAPFTRVCTFFRAGPLSEKGANS